MAVLELAPWIAFIGLGSWFAIRGRVLTVRGTPAVEPPAATTAATR